MNVLKTVLGETPGPLQATAVIVLYCVSPEESPAFRSLIEARDKLQREDGRIFIVLWDNSPSSQFRDHFPEDVVYFHDRRNLGLAYAYGQALESAARHGSQWLITLDQDTVVPSDYLLRMSSTAHQCANCTGVGAIVPQIASGSKQLSPSRFDLGAIPRWYRPGFRGLPDQAVFAFNSGSMIRVDALQQIGGYDLRFPLDYSDTAMFRKLHQHGKKVYIAGDIQLQHDFSLINLNRSMDGKRYRRLLSAESVLWDTHMNWLAGCERTARLLLRMFRHWIRKDRPDLRRVTLEFLTLRLFRSRKWRLRKWAQSADEAASLAQSSSAKSKQRPNVSVCMAAYNGARFIEAQLNSILPQLSADDEVVIVDDGSLDDTVARIVGIADSRIRLFTHVKNEGVVSTFEDALRSATGDILFLCDDDDLWAPTKVQQVLREFDANPDVQIVLSRALLIDERGHSLPDGRVNRHGRFFPGFWQNVLKNHYQGSAMAIRASLLGRVLPFPRRKSFLHDVWIGTRNEAAGGKAAFINQPLLYYRRHSQNASQTHRPLRQLRVRCELLIAHLSHALQFTTH